MRRYTFWLLFLFLNLFFVFAKIYQHNVFVNGVYIKQKIKSSINDTLLQINSLERKLSLIKNKHALLDEAKKRGMKPLRLSQIHEINRET